MVKCIAEVGSSLEVASRDSILLVTPDDVIVAVASSEEEALKYLPAGVRALGTVGVGEYNGDTISYVTDSIQTVRVKGTIEVISNKGVCTSQSEDRARQILRDAILLNGDNILSLDKPLPYSRSVYQLAIDLSHSEGSAPVITTHDTDCEVHNIDLDIIILPSSECGVRNLLLSQLEAVLQDLTRRPLHFQPPGLGVPMTLLDTQSRDMYHIFSLPPYSFFHPRQAIRDSDRDNERRFITPHKHVANVRSSDVYTVTGDYCYHHYMQDKFNDAGWGCAYRSLQTLCSWFWYNGYTDKQPPSHQQIQQTLVDLGDKPHTFINSRQWIGSVEVGYVVDAWVGGSHRIQYVSSGEDMSMQGGLLAHHFKTDGTPVMVGGGVLAHTILGVKYDDVTGDTKFLILDPHYTGKEDLQTIIKEGWCGWKDGKLWDKTAHYNMCLPVRPELEL